MLGWLWGHLPLGGDVARRLNLLWAACAAGAVALAASLAGTLTRRTGAHPAAAAAAAPIAGATLVVSPLLWSQATITEVYATGLAATLLLLRVALDVSPDAAWGTRRTAVVAGLTAAALGCLPQIALAAPGLAWFALVRVGRVPDRRLLAAGLIGGLAGLSVFAYLPLRAAAGAPSPWAEPTDPAGFWALASADIYRYHFSTLQPSERLDRVAESLGRLASEPTPAGAVLALAGAVWLWRADRAAVGCLGALLILTVAFRANYPADGNVVYLLPGVATAAVFAGVGGASLLDRLRHANARAAVVAGLAAAVVLVLRGAAVLPTVNLAGDDTARTWAAGVLGDLPPSALVVTDHDAATFGLWYLQAIGERPDVVVVDSRLLVRDWYRHDLLRRYPDLNAGSLRPGGLTALGRPVYLITGDPATRPSKAVRAP